MSGALSAPRSAASDDERPGQWHVAYVHLPKTGGSSIGAALAAGGAAACAQDAQPDELGMCDCAHRDCLQRSQAAVVGGCTHAAHHREASSRWQGHTVYVATIRLPRAWFLGGGPGGRRVRRGGSRLWQGRRRARTRRSYMLAGFGAVLEEELLAAGRRWQPPLRPRPSSRWRAHGAAAAAASARRRCRRRVLGSAAPPADQADVKYYFAGATNWRCSPSRARRTGRCARSRRCRRSSPSRGALAGRNLTLAARTRRAASGRRLLPETRAVESVEQHYQLDDALSRRRAQGLRRALRRREGGLGSGGQPYAARYPHLQSAYRNEHAFGKEENRKSRPPPRPHFIGGKTSTRSGNGR